MKTLQLSGRQGRKRRRAGGSNGPRLCWWCGRCLVRCWCWEWSPSLWPSQSHQWCAAASYNSPPRSHTNLQDGISECIRKHVGMHEGSKSVSLKYCEPNISGTCDGEWTLSLFYLLDCFLWRPWKPQMHHHLWWKRIFDWSHQCKLSLKAAWLLYFSYMCMLFTCNYLCSPLPDSALLF